MSNLIGSEVKVGEIVFGTVSEVTYGKNGEISIKIDPHPKHKIVSDLPAIKMEYQRPLSGIDHFRWGPIYGTPGYRAVSDATLTSKPGDQT